MGLRKKTRNVLATIHQQSAGFSGKFEVVNGLTSTVTNCLKGEFLFYYFSLKGESSEQYFESFSDGLNYGESILQNLKIMVCYGRKTPKG